MTIGVSRVFHCNVNATDLDRSLAFYRDHLGLTPSTRTTPAAPQPGGAFGLPETQWDAWILTGDRGYEGVALDLLEWQVPAPDGRPYPVANHLGFTRLGFVTSDIDAAYARLRAAGTDCFSEPHDVGVADSIGRPREHRSPAGADGRAAAPAGVRAFICTDPDGTMVELVTGDGDRLAFVAIGCRDLDRSVAFYEALGFFPLARYEPEPADGSDLRIGGDVEWAMAYLDDPRGTGAFALDLVQWKQPPPAGEPYDAANHTGIYRMALLTDDIDASYEGLRRLGVECVSPPATLDMGPGLPELRALLFPDPDGTMLELIESPG